MFPMNLLLQTHTSEFIHTVKNTNLPHYRDLDSSEVSLSYNLSFIHEE